MTSLNAPTKHGGILIPLDPIRVSHLAAIAAELLVSKARNINDATLVLTRHPQSALLLGRITGSIVGDDPVAFWRENADIAVAMSQVLPRQCFMYYVQSAPPSERREAFLVAQRGQVLAADEGDAQGQAPGAEHWPVAKLCEQLRLTIDELAGGFEGGPSAEISLLEPNVDDQAILMALAGQPEADGAPKQSPSPAGGGAAPAAAKAAPATNTGAAAGAAPKGPPKVSVADDLKRREKERAEETAQQQRRAQEVESSLRFTVDELGIVSCPQAELSEPDILRPLLVSSLAGDLPPGLPRSKARVLQGKRCDIALRVDFLSEVFLESVPLSRPVFNERAEDRAIGDRELKVLEVLAPRLGYGSLVSTGKAPHVFVSRKPDLPLPEDLILELLADP